MSKLALVVPFKATNYKSRLSSVLDESERRQLAHMLLNGVLSTVSRAGLSASCHVVSSDRDALEEAEKKGASGIQEAADAGVNSAVRLAMRVLRRTDSFIVLPSDLPLLSSAELRLAVRWGQELDVVISPSSSFNGTNLLLFSRSRSPVLSYDDNSFWNHLGSAAERRLQVGVYTAGGVVFDLDSPSDARQLIRTSANTRAARFLKRALRS